MVLCLVVEGRTSVYYVVNTNDSGAGSFRSAITNANATAGTNYIFFNLPGEVPHVLAPKSPYPVITRYPLIIDATTQPGYSGRPLVHINGSGIGSSGDGLQIQAGSSTVKGLAIYKCNRDAIRIQGGSGGNIIQGNYLGTDSTGTNHLGNGSGGVYIYRSSSNLIGGTNIAERNVISGGNNHGVIIDNASLPSIGTNNAVVGNFIGVASDGITALGNTNNGVYLNTAIGNIIGGTNSNAGNRISANGGSGIYLNGAGSSQNCILGNYIGTDATGMLPLPNRQDGITIFGASSNWIGGTGENDGNLVSGNLNRGILIAGGAVANLICNNYIGTDSPGRFALGNHTNGVAIFNSPANRVVANLISGNQQSGVLITQTGSVSNFVVANLIGTDISGSNALPNTYNGISVDTASYNVIGGELAANGNVVSGNGQNGIHLLGPAGGTNYILGNLIGTDVNGTRPVGNVMAGIAIQSDGNQIGGAGSQFRNIISGNQQSGIYLWGTRASNNVVQCNYIGTDYTGSTPMGNGPSGFYSGLAISNAPSNKIGGIGLGNVISANGDKGITLNGLAATGEIIQGNYIGTDFMGLLPLGNTNGGIYIYSAGDNRIGGILPGMGNIISANGAVGVYCSGASSNLILGNFLGTKADGASALGNLWHNIEFLNAASNNQVGDGTPAGDNRIAHVRTAGYDGIRVRDGCLGNLVLGNSIFSNGNETRNGLGIDIGADGISITNIPSLQEVAGNDRLLVIAGVLTNASNRAFHIQFYANHQTNVTGFGEGLVYIGATNVSTDASGYSRFVLGLSRPSASLNWISATATDVTKKNNTSEFSMDQMVAMIPAISFATTNSSIIYFGRGRYYTNSVTTLIGVCWPNTQIPYTLMQCSNLAFPTVWNPVTNGITLVGATNYLFYPSIPHSGSDFYRLEF